MHNERNNAIGLDRDLELKWNQKKKMEEMTKESLKKSCETDQKVKLYCRLRKMCKLISHDHAKILHSHAKCSKKL